jgi:hypothetical protein
MGSVFDPEDERRDLALALALDLFRYEYLLINDFFIYTL